MKPKSEKSIELYHLMLRRGYPEEFCDVDNFRRLTEVMNITSVKDGIEQV